MQNQPQHSVYEKAREIIIQNAQKGQLYRVQFADDPEVYEGMPVAAPDLTSDDDNAFEMRVSGPTRKGEVLRRSLRDVTWIEEA